MYQNCNCPDIPQECIPEPLIPVCADPEYCEEAVSDKCIVHTGENLPNLDIATGERLDSILTKLNDINSPAGLIDMLNNAAVRNAIKAILQS